MSISLVSIKISSTPHTNHGDFDVEISFSCLIDALHPFSARILLLILDF